jgi:hypothetical protein
VPCSGRSIKSLKWFFVVSCGLLVFIAAGLVASGVNFFTYAGLFGTLFPYEVRHAAPAVPGMLCRAALCMLPCLLCTWAGLLWGGLPQHPPPPFPTPHAHPSPSHASPADRNSCLLLVLLYCCPVPPCRTARGTTRSCGTPPAAATCTQTTSGPSSAPCLATLVGGWVGALPGCAAWVRVKGGLRVPHPRSVWLHGWVGALGDAGSMWLCGQGWRGRDWATALAGRGQGKHRHSPQRQSPTAAIPPPFSYPASRCLLLSPLCRPAHGAQPDVLPAVLGGHPGRHGLALVHRHPDRPQGGPGGRPQVLCTPPRGAPGWRRRPG